MMVERVSCCNRTIFDKCFMHCVGSVFDEHKSARLSNTARSEIAKKQRDNSRYDKNSRIIALGFGVNRQLFIKPACIEKCRQRRHVNKKRSNNSDQPGGPGKCSESTHAMQTKFGALSVDGVFSAHH